MTLGYVYVWEACETEFTGGRVRATTEPLLHLIPEAGKIVGLNGRYVDVVNAGRINEPDPDGPEWVSAPIGNARPNAEGNFIFEPCAGGGQFDKSAPFTPAEPARYISASHFGEVNVYYHITRIADRFDKLLACLGAKPLPKVRVSVSTHKTTTQRTYWRAASRDSEGVKWLPVRGTQYRYPAKGNSARTGQRIRRSSELCFGPALSWTQEGWLPRIAGTVYRCDPSHIAGYIYHEYGRHVVHHTADLQANALRAPRHQIDVKTPTDAAIGDYWAASMLCTPHIACWHCRHDPLFIHPRSLASSATMGDFDGTNAASVHQNGTILAAALWDLRESLEAHGDPNCDLLVLSALLNVRRLVNDSYRPDVDETRRLRNGFSVFAGCLLHADAVRFDGKYSNNITRAMRGRGIGVCGHTRERLAERTVPSLSVSLAGTPAVREHVDTIRARFPEAIIPRDDELVHPDAFEVRLPGSRETQYDLVAVGDVMTGMRMRHRIRRHGPEYVFAWVKPVFQRAAVIVGNLESPFAESTEQEATTRNFSYKVKPQSASVLRRAGFSAMTLANNHLLDCGREGVRETLVTLERQGIEAIGGGANESTAHDPAIFDARGGRIGLLGYYWNRRTAARGDLPGSARDLPELVERDMERLRPQVDRIAVVVHWGVPYERLPSVEDRAKARHFVDCGADIVIGHHPHIIQPMEIYRDRPIFYSVGNFAFGSGNSKAESLLLGVRFLDNCIEVDIFPVYVQNRDPRLDYQPKIMRGGAAMDTLRRLTSISGNCGERIEINEFYGRLRIDGPGALGLERVERLQSVVTS